MSDETPGRFARIKSVFTPTASIPLAENQSQTQGGGAVAAAVRDAQIEIKKKRGRPAGAAAGTGGSGSAPAGPELAKLQADLDRLFAPEMWKPIVTLPANTMMALTGHPHWEIPKDDADNLANAASVAMRYTSITNPGMLALVLFAVQAVMVYAPRTLVELNIRKQERAAKADS